MTIYLAGPMRGVAAYNFPAFDRAAEYLRSLGHGVVSPAEIDRAHGFDEDSPEPTPGELPAWPWSLRWRNCWGWRSSTPAPGNR
jgi:hypothetical protein